VFFFAVSENFGEKNPQFSGSKGGALQATTPNKLMANVFSNLEPLAPAVSGEEGLGAQAQNPPWDDSTQLCVFSHRKGRFSQFKV